MNLKFFKDKNSEPWLAAGLISLVTVLTYGILISQLGFYRDDWYMLWAGRFQGLSGIINLFQTDRPFAGWVYAMSFNFIGANVLYWQVYGLLMKILTGLTVFWMMRLIWPEKRLETTLIALLFVLYPGFYQQPVAGTFVIDLLGLAAAFISMALTIYALQTPSRLRQIVCIAAAMLLGVIYLALYEGTIGLEVVRWTLVWYVLNRRDPASIRAINLRALKQLLPYFAMLAGFVVWRLFIFDSTRRATNINVLLANYASNPLYSFAQIVMGYLKDLFETIVLAWFVPFYQFTVTGRPIDFFSGFALALVVLAFVAAYFFWYRRQHPEPETNADPTSRHFLWIGFISVAFPSAVIVLLGRNVLFSIQWDHYTTQSMLGVAIFALGFILYFLRGSLRWVILFGLLFLSVMTHYHSAVYYRDFWNYEKTTWWQLAWRAPDLQPGTTLIVSLPEGFQLAEEYEVWGPANLVYTPVTPLSITGQVVTDTLFVDLGKGKVDERLMRNVPVVRDYAQALIVSRPSDQSCVHVIDGRRPFLPLLENGQIVQSARYSRIAQIDPLAAPKLPPVETFGPEPAKTWCYYYQKMELALQRGDWQQAADLADEADQKSLNPADLTEWMPALEAYANSGQDKKAAQLVKRIKSNPAIRDLLCLEMADMTEWPAGYQSEKIVVPLCGAK